GAAVRAGARHRGNGQRPDRERPARDQRVRVRPDLRAGFFGADHGGDEPGGQGRDQPPGPRAARPGAGHRRAARRVAPHRRRRAPHRRPPGCARTTRRPAVRAPPSPGRESPGGVVNPGEGAPASRREPGDAAGDEAPDFTLTDADGKQVTLSSLRGQQVIVYFYPAAMTPGCTTEACDFRDNIASLAAAGVTVLGISPDPPAKLAKFRDRDGLN